MGCAPSAAQRANRVQPSASIPSENGGGDGRNVAPEAAAALARASNTQRADAQLPGGRRETDTDSSSNDSTDIHPLILQTLGQLKGGNPNQRTVYEATRVALASMFLFTSIAVASTSPFAGIIITSFRRGGRNRNHSLLLTLQQSLIDYDENMKSVFGRDKPLRKFYYHHQVIRYS